MHMLYDSDSFVVVQIRANAPDASDLTSASTSARPELARNGFEIVDKRSGKEVYLDGSWAEMFQQHLIAWAKNTPTQEEIEDTLESYSGLANTPISLH
ncbi:BTH_I0359 family protein [Polaromonas sp.]|uniref:BTH_I0359 family protein n=1 Tax=Polaromonas sp. TaxID=1869339 RepID=UPI002FC863A2